MPLVKVLHASFYNFKDEKDGRMVKGCKLTYLGPNEATDRSKGSPPVTLTGDESIYHNLPQLPADLHIETDVVMKKGIPTAVLSSVKALVKA